ncbi:MAG TPA: ATP-binding protein [Methylomirabilota bacterium]
MSPLRHLVDRVARRIGGPRMLAFPLLRWLAVLAGLVWILLAPPEYAGWRPVHSAMLGFLLYSVALTAALWRWPGRMLRLNVFVLAADLGFALLLIRLTGGAPSILFLALLLIAGLQSYYYGIVRGVAFAALAGAAYVAVVWPTIAGAEWSNIAVRLAMLVGTAVGVGVLGQVEDRERQAVAGLTVQAQERERFIQSVVESLREGVVAVDRAGRIVAFNRAMEAQTGLAGRDVIGGDFFDVLPAYSLEAVRGPIAQLLRGETEGFTLEAIELEQAPGTRMVQNVKGSLLRQHGEPSGAVLLVQDITERATLERTARQAEKLAALGTMAAGLAHELNNPIGIISSRIEIMLLDAQAQPVHGQFAEDLRVLHRHAQRVARIAHGLLSFSRQSSGGRGPVDLNHLVEETLLLIERPMTKQGVTVTRRLAPALPPLWGDGNTLQQVVLNLLTNARDAVAGEGEITVETSRTTGKEETVRLLVRDTGSGIPPEALPRIFEPFFTTKSDGTGLGLSISYGIVRDHHGTVDVQSRPGEGTTFVLTFPVSGAPAAVAEDA